MGLAILMTQRGRLSLLVEAPLLGRAWRIRLRGELPQTPDIHQPSAMRGRAETRRRRVVAGERQVLRGPKTLLLLLRLVLLNTLLSPVH